MYVNVINIDIYIEILVADQASRNMSVVLQSLVHV